jgi:hypothetical protein
MGFEAIVRVFFIRPHQPRMPGHIGGDDRGKTPGLGSCRFAGCQAQAIREQRVIFRLHPWRSLPIPLQLLGKLRSQPIMPRALPLTDLGAPKMQ